MFRVVRTIHLPLLERKVVGIMVLSIVCSTASSLAYATLTIILVRALQTIICSMPTQGSMYWQIVSE